MNYPGVTRLFDIPKYQQKHFPQAKAFNDKVMGEWKSLSIDAFLEKANTVSMALLDLGFQDGDKIAVISNNRSEWNYFDIGMQQIGVANVPIYPTSTSCDYEYIMNDAGVKMVIVSDEALLSKVLEVKNNIPTLQWIYSFNRIVDCHHISELEAMCTGIDLDRINAISDKVTADSLATLIYTSGTTGKPKGVMLSHNNLVSNAIDSSSRFPVHPGYRAMSFLPVCHVYERMLLYLYMLNGIEIYFAESLETISDNMKECKPHVFTAVPRLLEKVYDKIIAKGAELSGIKKSLFFWAVELANTFEPYGANGAWYEFKLKIARKLIFSKWQEALGGEVLLIASGSAALSPRLARIYLAAGINVMEGYGLTETSPVISVNDLRDNGLKIGSVGRLLPHVQVSFAEDGEILVKGPNVMKGYYKNPEKTAEVIDADGWFHTGDIGCMLDGGFLKITDRKKEMFKTSGGKYVAPQILENKFKESKFIEQLVVIGENQKFPAALIIPNFEFLKGWCTEKGLGFTTNAEAITKPEVIARIQREVDTLNETFGQWEKIKKFVLLPREFSIEKNEMTPTLKLKRKVINVNYESEINSIYS
jgi:long-chain acyl-CoA synthetase